MVSSTALISFLAIVAFVAVAFFYGYRSTRGSSLTAAIVLLFWLGVSAVLALSGLLQMFDRRPPPLPIFVLFVSAATAGLAFSKVGDHLIDGLDVRYLIGFQVFRIPVELFLHRLYEEGVVPIQMTYSGYNFDIFSGILAAIILIWAFKRRPPRWAIWAFNLIGLGLLINIVTISMLSTPTPLRRFHNEPANTFVAAMPYVWLPAFLVQAAWFGHLIVFRWLGRSRPATASL